MAKQYKSRMWMYMRWVVQRKSVKDMALECECSEETINRYLNYHGLRETRKQ